MLRISTNFRLAIVSGNRLTVTDFSKNIIFVIGYLKWWNELLNINLHDLLYYSDITIKKQSMSGLEQQEERLRKKVNSIIITRNLSSVMNNTKWRELYQAIEELPFPPPYVRKELIDLDELSEKKFDCDVWYEGDWCDSSEHGVLPFYCIEWIQVRPRLAKHRGRLIADEIIDETEEFRAILTKYSIPYEEENGNFMIYGYK